MFVLRKPFLPILMFAGKEAYLRVEYPKGRHGIQYNDTQQKTLSRRHSAKDTQRYGLICDTQHKCV
jgi:hypothetical protein